MNDEIIEIIEGGTKLLVPKGSMTEKVPPKEPAFFNPRASLSRDLSIIACSAFWKDYKFPKIFFDGLSGLGARGLRIANEVNEVEKVNAIMINIEKKRYSPRYHYLQNYGMYNSGKKLRDFIVNIDPSLSHHVDFLAHIQE